eukprot:431436-Pelagomonas_calceolata.AAC.2
MGALHVCQREGSQILVKRGQAPSGGMGGMDIRLVEGGACGLGAGQGVHLMRRHQCSKGCSTGFCVVSSC